MFRRGPTAMVLKGLPKIQQSKKKNNTSMTKLDTKQNEAQSKIMQVMQFKHWKKTNKTLRTFKPVVTQAKDTEQASLGLTCTRINHTFFNA